MQPRGVLPRCCASAAEFALYGCYCMIADQAERAATLPLHGRLPQAARAQHLRRGAHARFGWLFLRGFAGAAVSRQPVLPWKQCTALEAMGAHQGRMHFPSLVCRFGARVKLGPQLLDLFLSGPPAAHPLFSCAFQKGDLPLGCPAGARRVRGQGGRQDARPLPHLLGCDGAPGGKSRILLFSLFYCMGRCLLAYRG